MLTRVVVLALLAACAKSPRGLYLTDLDDQTGKLVVQSDLGTALRVRGTYLSPTFRTALADERQRLVGVDDENHSAFLARTRDDGDAYHEVVFTAESDMETRTRFGDTDAHWQLRLEADGDEQKLVTVHRVREPSSLHAHLYSHVTLWTELWIARFERSNPAPAELVLHVGSGYGHGVITWSGDQLR